MNLSDKTRKQQVLDYLMDRKGQWVDGTQLATAEIGGSEGLRRLRELCMEYTIEQRMNPDRSKSGWQYRLVEDPPVSPLRGNAPSSGSLPSSDKPRLVFGLNKICPTCRGKGCPACSNNGWL